MLRRAHALFVSACHREFKMSDTCPVCGSGDTRFLGRDRFDTRNRYLRCRSCGSGFSLLRVHDITEAASLHTSAYFTVDNDGYTPVPVAEAHFLARLLGLKSSGRLLDVGCGRGRWLKYIREHSRFQVEGVEPSPEAAAYGREIYGLTVVTGDLHSSAYPDGIFDVVYLRNVLEHIAAPQELRDEIHRILKPGGICAVHVPNDASITNTLKRALYRTGSIREFGSLFYPLHVTGFTPRSLDRIFRDGGFRRAARETLSKVQRAYEFPLTRQDMPLLPAAALELLLGRGNLLLGWYERE